MNEEEIMIIMTKMGFKYNKENNCYSKVVVPGGDIRGQKFVLFARYNKEKGTMEWWSKPDYAFLGVLGEVKAWKAIMNGSLDPKKWDITQPVTITNEQGGKEIIELTPTPEDLKKEAGEDKEKKIRKEEKENKKEREIKKVDHYKMIQKITGYDIFEIFSDSGTGKSKIALEIARNAKENGHTVFYYDTEGNITEEEASFLKDNYKYSPSMEDLLNFKLPDVDLIIFDSITYPFWIAFASMNLKERGEALLKLHAYLGKLKIWCVKNKKLAIVVSQAISELGAKSEEERRPWGGKAFHIAKEIIKPELQYSSPNETLIKLFAYRMRKYGRGYHIADVLINNKGVKITWKI